MRCGSEIKTVEIKVGEGIRGFQRKAAKKMGKETKSEIVKEIMEK